MKTTGSFLTNLTHSWKFSFALRIMAEELTTKISLVPFVNELFSVSSETCLNLCDVAAELIQTVVYTSKQYRLGGSYFRALTFYSYLFNVTDMLSVPVATWNSFF